MPRIGVLALQGGFSAHVASLSASGAETLEVRHPRSLDGLQGLVIPGGESSTLLNLMADEPWFDALKRFHAKGRPIFGTCAGAILLAGDVVEPAQPSLGLLNAVMARNAYGRQRDSFETRLKVIEWDVPLEAIFIRAPRFREVGPQVEVLARLGDEPVLVRQGSLLAATFHAELTTDTRLHRLFVEMALEPNQTENSVRRPAVATRRT